MPMPVLAVQQPNNSLVGGLIALVSLLAGALVVGLAWALMLQRSPQQASIAAPKEVPRSEAPAPRRPAPEPSKPAPALVSGISEADATAIVEQWLSVKQLIFAPPFDTDRADQLVAAVPALDGSHQVRRVDLVAPQQQQLFRLQRHSHQ
jgi:predicted lipid-binding transport protein (Tim44 family)